MPKHLRSRHRIVVDAPLARAFMYFTPAGEELWVDGWQPRYVHPADGATTPGMVFVTGAGDETTFWTLVDFDRERHRSRYLRCTPASRMTVVEIACSALDADRTEVEVGYTLTALNQRGEEALGDFEGERFAAMIDGWAHEIAARRDSLLAARLR